MGFSDSGQLTLHTQRQLFVVKGLVALDFLAISLVLPLMSSYFREAGVTPSQAAWISSTFQLSQIVGGVLMGSMGDGGGGASKKNVLLLSFAGSAVSYLIVGLSETLPLLFASRVVVGLVKQTMTTSTAIISEACKHSSEERAKHLGHLSGSASVAFVVGPAVGAMLYKRAPALPAVTAAAIFGVNIFLCLFFLDTVATTLPPTPTTAPALARQQQQGGLASATGHLSLLVGRVRSLCTRPSTLAIVVVRLFLSFVDSALSPRQLLSYYEDKFSIKTHVLGWQSSLSSAASIAVDLLLLQPLLQGLSSSRLGNSHTLCALLSALAAAAIAEASTSSFSLFLATSYLPSLVISMVLSAKIKSLLIDSLPVSSVGTSLGVLGLLSSGVGVVSPLYGSMLLSSPSTLGAGAWAGLGLGLGLGGLTKSNARGLLQAAHLLLLGLGVLLCAPSLDSIKAASSSSSGHEDSRAPPASDSSSSSSSSSSAGAGAGGGAESVVVKTKGLGLSRVPHTQSQQLISSPLSDVSIDTPQLLAQLEQERSKKDK